MDTADMTPTERIDHLSAKAYRALREIQDELREIEILSDFTDMTADDRFNLRMAKSRAARIQNDICEMNAAIATATANV